MRSIVATTLEAMRSIVATTLEAMRSIVATTLEAMRSIVATTLEAMRSTVYSSSHDTGSNEKYSSRDTGSNEQDKPSNGSTFIVSQAVEALVLCLNAHPWKVPMEALFGDRKLKEALTIIYQLLKYLRIII